ncbi:MAG: sigma-54-dependent Fis family transcriptional regulator [Kiritimatiellae bacterium]|nr:sigma-54-dependent Fis family transcriptional regulator [Kiritimatiellia bacterium]
MMTTILIVDDEAGTLLLLRSLFKSNGYAVKTAGDGASALEIIKAGGVDITVTDQRMEPMDGMALFHEIRKAATMMPVIMLTGYASIEMAIDAMKSGVFDYLTKPFKVDDMLACLKRAEEQIAKNAASAKMLKSDATIPYVADSFIASSLSMKKVCETIQKVGPTPATVLINGESGTGKEVIARTIHKASTRANGPWVAVNCAALPENLLESEMFGHVKGAFTGAFADKEGLFEAANGGTLFLDEISSMPLVLQGKLLRVLQEHEIRRVGSVKAIPVDVRVIAASNADLEKAVANGTFRGDLYYRFAVITIDIPPLRERPEDILPLALHFIRSEADDDEPAPNITPEAARVLTSYEWPGNVRELENAIRHALTFLSDGDITVDLLPSKIQRQVPASGGAAIPGAVSLGQGLFSSNTSLKSFLKQREREYIEYILSTTNGDKEKAAEMLNVNLSTLYRKLADE